MRVTHIFPLSVLWSSAASGQSAPLGKVESVGTSSEALFGATYSIYDYAREVCDELGPFPSFDAFDPNLSHELPITQDGIPLTGATATPESLCDRPPLLGLGINGQAIPPLENRATARL